MGKQIDTILNEGIIYEESLDMKDRHALIMLRNAADDVVEIIDAKTGETGAETDCSVALILMELPLVALPGNTIKRCSSYRQKYEQKGWDTVY